MRSSLLLRHQKTIFHNACRGKFITSSTRNPHRSSQLHNICQHHRHRLPSIWMLTSRSTSTTSNERIEKKKSNSNGPAIKEQIETYGVISKTLYRQILKWTKTTGDVPFDPIPPLTFFPPLIGKESLEALSLIKKSFSDEEIDIEGLPQASDVDNSSHDFYHDLIKLLPTNSIVDESKLVIPIDGAKSVQDITRFLFALNHYNYQTAEDENDDDSLSMIKDRVSLGFDVLKSLNELSLTLDERRKLREKHCDRNGVLFHVGQVVQHKTMRWRAIVAGWNKEGNDDDDQKSSLTTKVYEQTSTENQEAESDIEYTVLLDEGDAVLSRARVLGSKRAKQHELETVMDPFLKRVRCSIAGSFFDKFDSDRNEFHPGPVLTFEYPRDLVDLDALSDNVNENEKKKMGATTPNEYGANLVIKEIRSLAFELNSYISETMSTSNNETMILLSQTREEIQHIINGTLDKPSDTLSSSTPASSQKVAVKYLGALLDVMNTTNQVMMHRRTSKLNKERVHFPLGTVVKHKKYNFRGVVTGWDAHPRTDVSRWDGLQHIEDDVNNMPFYHIIADTNDTEEAFGHQRRFRYVCQENLEPCDPLDRNVKVDLDDGWIISKGGPVSVEFIAPNELKFQHGEELDSEINEKGIEMCINKLFSKMNSFLGTMRIESKDSTKKDMTKLDHIFHILESADCLEDARVVEEFIKEIWKVHEDNEIRWSLEDGTEALIRGDKTKALHIFEDIINNQDPNYLEAYNKKATCHYLLGEMKKSIEAAEKACEMEPRHFQAYAGIGLVYNDTIDISKATEYFRRSLRLQPWSPVSSRLAVCLDLLKRRLSKEEEVDE